MAVDSSIKPLPGHVVIDACGMPCCNGRGYQASIGPDGAAVVVKHGSVNAWDPPVLWAWLLGACGLSLRIQWDEGLCTVVLCLVIMNKRGARGSTSMSGICHSFVSHSLLQVVMYLSISGCHIHWEHGWS